MYTYGPYDAEVLNDIGLAETLNAVSVKTVQFSQGYGYEIRTAQGAAAVKSRSAEWLRSHADSISRIANEFGGQRTSDLELSTTIIYLNRESAKSEARQSAFDLARKVQAVKPRFSDEIILDRIESLQTRGHLVGVQIPAKAIESL